VRHAEKIAATEHNFELQSVGSLRDKNGVNCTAKEMQPTSTPIIKIEFSLLRFYLLNAMNIIRETYQVDRTTQNA
jgi:hypothetical protein